MQQAQDIPYQLLGLLDQASSMRGLSSETSNTAQAATTAYITTMYYSALSNLYLQSILPNDITEVNAQMPRVRIALERSFTDFRQAAKWLAANNEFINTSPAKEYYNEVINLDNGALKNMATFYPSANSSQVGVSVDGVLKFLHYYDPQNENEDTARAFQSFMVKNVATVAAGGDGIVRELYEQFKKQRNK